MGRKDGCQSAPNQLIRVCVPPVPATPRTQPCPPTGAYQPHRCSGPAPVAALASRVCPSELLRPSASRLPLERARGSSPSLSRAAHLPLGSSSKPAGPRRHFSPRRPQPENSPASVRSPAPSPPSPALRRPPRPPNTPPPTATGSPRAGRAAAEAFPGRGARPRRGGLTGRGPRRPPAPRVRPRRPNRRGAPLTSAAALLPTRRSPRSGRDGVFGSGSRPRSGRALQPCPARLRPPLPPASGAPPPPRPLCSSHWLLGAGPRPSAPSAPRIGPGCEEAARPLVHKRTSPERHWQRLLSIKGGAPT